MGNNMLQSPCLYVKEEAKMMKVIRNKWYAHFYYEGNYYCDPLNAYKHEKWKAIKAVGALRYRIEKDLYVHANATMIQAEKMFLCTIKDKSKTFISQQKGLLKNHIMPFLGDLKIIEIDTAKILEYKNFREEKGTPKNSLSKEIITLVNTLRCVQKNFKIPQLEYKNKGKKIINKLTMNDVERISTFVKQQSTRARMKKGPYGEQYYLIYWIYVYTGMDTGDVLKLTPNNIDFKKEMINVELGRAKTGVEFAVPICPALMKILRSLPRSFDKEKAYFEGITNSQINKAIQKAFRCAGYDSGGSKMFRHFVVSQLAIAGTPEAVTQKIVGHVEGSKLTHRVYTHIDDETAKKHYGKAFGAKSNG